MEYQVFLQEVELAFSNQSQVQVSTTSESFSQFSLSSILQSDKILGDEPKKIVVILPSAKDCSLWFHYLKRARIKNDDGEVSVNIFPSYSCWGTERFANHAPIHRSRLAALANLSDENNHTIVVSTIDAMSQFTISEERFKENSFHLKVNEESDFEILLEKLEDIGYQKCAKVEDEGYWALRGGIVDVFPPNYTHPIRLEFIGDTLGSIREYDLESQRSIQEVDSIRIVPASECLTFAKDRKKNSQLLYSALLDQEIDQHDRDGMMASFSQGVRFSGFDMFYPLFREDPSLLVDYLKGDALFYFPKPIESCFEHFKSYFADL